MTRKTPIRHKVHTYQKDNGKTVQNFMRGKGQKLSKIANPAINSKNSIKSRCQKALSLIKYKLGWIDNVKIVYQSQIEGKLISPQGWDVTGLEVYGFIPKLNSIILPDNVSELDTNQIIHEYGHYLYHKNPSLAHIKIPPAYPIKTNKGQAEIYNIFHGSNDEWFAYHFAFYIEGKTKEWHPIEKEIMHKMLGEIQEQRH